MIISFHLLRREGKEKRKYRRIPEGCHPVLLLWLRSDILAFEANADHD
jgi:hypothetical protein